MIPSWASASRAAQEEASLGIPSHVPAVSTASLALPTQPGTVKAAESGLWLLSSAQDNLHREQEQLSLMVSVSGAETSVSGAVTLPAIPEGSKSEPHF